MLRGGKAQHSYQILIKSKKFKNLVQIYTLCDIFYLYGSEMYRLYMTKLYGPVMINLYKENDVMIEIMGKS